MRAQPPPTLEAARALFDATSLHAASSLPSALSSLDASTTTLHVLPPSPHFPLPAHATPAGAESAYLLPALHRARLTKDAAELALIRRACGISSRAHETVMRVLGGAVRSAAAPAVPEGRPALPGEWLIEREDEAEAIFVASCRREGSVVPFPAPSCAH
jgi:Xaa-Pro dipeptidase